SEHGKLCFEALEIKNSASKLLALTQGAKPFLRSRMVEILKWILLWKTRTENRTKADASQRLIPKCTAMFFALRKKRMLIFWLFLTNQEWTIRLNLLFRCCSERK